MERESDDEVRAGLTVRSLTAILLKLIGIWYLLYAVADALALVSIRYNLPLPEIAAWRLQNTALTLIADLGIALLLMLHGDRISRFLFRQERPLHLPAIGVREALWIGAGLIGVWLVANDLAQALNRAIEIVWYAGADRRTTLGDRHLEAILSGLKSLVFVAIGAVLLLLSAKRLGLRAPRSESSPPEAALAEEGTPPEGGD